MPKDGECAAASLAARLRRGEAIRIRPLLSRGSRRALVAAAALSCGAFADPPIPSSSSTNASWVASQERKLSGNLAHNNATTRSPSNKSNSTAPADSGAWVNWTWMNSIWSSDTEASHTTREANPAIPTTTTTSPSSSSPTPEPAKPPMQPVLLGLEPSIGPVDGGTWVRLQTFALNISSRPCVRIRPLWSPSTKVSKEMENASRLFETSVDEENLWILLPNIQETFGKQAVPRALLLSLEGSACTNSSSSSSTSTSRSSQSSQLPSPVYDDLGALFRLYGPLEQSVPDSLFPCCDLKLSGGQELSFFSSASQTDPPPFAHPVIRFRRGTMRRDVTGRLVMGRGDDDEDTPATLSSLWHVRATSPGWPRAEGKVQVELAWNGQQFGALPKLVSFIEEESFFGDAVQGIMEDHIPGTDGGGGGLAPGSDAEIGSNKKPDSQGDIVGPHSAVVQEMVTVVEDAGGGGHSARSGPDLSHVTLLDPDDNSFILSRARDLAYLQEDLRFVHDLLFLTIAATVGGLLAARAGLPGVIGFLLGGALAGPGGTDSITELVQVESMAEIGVCLLLFCLGLEFSLKELAANVPAALAGLLAVITLCGTLVLLAAGVAQTSLNEALCIGLFASLSSTPVSLRAMPSANQGNPRFHHDHPPRLGEKNVLTTILVTQDMVLAGLLAALPKVFRATGEFQEEEGEPDSEGSMNIYAMPPPSALEQPYEGWWQSQLLLTGMSLLTVITLVMFFRRTWLLRATHGWSAVFHEKLLSLDDEFFALVILSYAFFLAYLTDFLGLSIELGAFAAGLSLASTDSAIAHRAEQRLGGLKDVFAALFFGSIGLVVSGRFLLDNLSAILSVVIFIFIMKTLTAYPPIRLLATRNMPAPALTAVRLSCTLAHVGEFGFVLAARGSSLGVLSRHVYLLLIGVNSVSLCLTPWMFWVLNYVLSDEAVPLGAARGARRRP